MLELLIAAVLGGVVAQGGRRILGQTGQAHPFGPGNQRGLNTNLGSIPMISSRGVARYATYRAIYLTNPWVYAAVNKLARDIARLPLHVFELDADGERRRVRGDLPTQGAPSAGARLDNILTHPEKLSRFNFWKGTATDRLVYGNALWLPRWESGGMPVGLRRERWRNVQSVPEGSDGQPLYYQITTDSRGFGGSRRYAADEVIHLGRGSDSESALGVSPLESCSYTIALYEGVIRHLVAYFENQARPSGAIEEVDKLTKDKAELIRKMVMDAYTSPENAGKILVTSGKYRPISETPEHNKVVELIKLSREETAAVYGVPPPVLGILDNAIMANVKELRSEYVREGLGPWTNDFQDEIKAQFLRPVPAWRTLFTEFLLAEQLRPDLEARATVYQQTKHVFSIDEQRRIENMSPIGLKGVTDVPWIDSGAMPVTAFESGSEFMQEAARAYGRRLAEGSLENQSEAQAANGHKETEEIQL